MGRGDVGAKGAVLDGRLGLVGEGKREPGQPLLAMAEAEAEAQPSPLPSSSSSSSSSYPPPRPTFPAPSLAHPSPRYDRLETPPQTPVRISSSARSSVGVWAVRRCVLDWVGGRGR